MSRGGFFNQLKDDLTKAFRPSASGPRCGMLRLPPRAWRRSPRGVRPGSRSSRHVLVCVCARTAPACV